MAVAASRFPIWEHYSKDSHLSSAFQPRTRIFVLLELGTAMNHLKYIKIQDLGDHFLQLCTQRVGTEERKGSANHKRAFFDFSKTITD